MRTPELIFEDALDAFLAAESGQLLKGVSERSTCTRLAVFLERQLQLEGVTGYYADTEYNRTHHGYVKTIIDGEHRAIQITTDLIVHTRGEKPPPHDNLIAIEAKKAFRPDQEKLDDKNRLRAMTQPNEKALGWGGHPKPVCGYALGVFLEIDVRNRRLGLEYFRNGSAQEKKDRAL